MCVCVYVCVCVSVSVSVTLCVCLPIDSWVEPRVDSEFDTNILSWVQLLNWVRAGFSHANARIRRLLFVLHGIE